MAVNGERNPEHKHFSTLHMDLILFTRGFSHHILIVLMDSLFKVYRVEKLSPSMSVTGVQLCTGKRRRRLGDGEIGWTNLCESRASCKHFVANYSYPSVATFDVLYPSKDTYASDVDSDSTNPYILLQPVPDLSRIFNDYPTENREGLGLVLSTFPELFLT
jgi:hypothetical protein